MLPTREVYGRRLELCPDRNGREQLVGKSLALHRQRQRGSSGGETEIQAGKAKNHTKGKPEPPLRRDEGKDADVSTWMRPSCEVGGVVRSQKCPEGGIWKAF